MKRFYHILLIVGILSGCSTEDSLETNDRFARLNVSFGVPLTYADGFDATPEEKALKSVALFIETAGGEFYSHMSHRADDFESLKTDVDGNIYALGLKIGSTNIDGKAWVAMIGNYAENGLTDALTAVTSMQELADVRSNDIDEYPIVSPFLASLETEVEFLGGTTQTVHSILERLAARIDVKLTFLKDGAELAPVDLLYQPEVKIFSPKQKSYLLVASNQSISNIAQAAVMRSTLTSHATNLTLTYYTYETSELDIIPLLVKIFYLGSGFQEQNLVIKDGDGKTVIKRNHYYDQDITIVMP